jgi:hypothetical protein
MPRSRRLGAASSALIRGEAGTWRLFKRDYREEIGLVAARFGRAGDREAVLCAPPNPLALVSAKMTSDSKPFPMKYMKYGSINAW